MTYNCNVLIIDRKLTKTLNKKNNTLLRERERERERERGDYHFTQCICRLGTGAGLPRVFWSAHRGSSRSVYQLCVSIKNVKQKLNKQNERMNEKQL